MLIAPFIVLELFTGKELGDGQGRELFLDETFGSGLGLGPAFRVDYGAVYEPSTSQKNGGGGGGGED